MVAALTDKGLSVNLVLDDRSRAWIIEKMAQELCAALQGLGIEASVTPQSSAASTVNHFTIFHYVDPKPGTLNTVAITHIDDALKIDMVRKQLASGVRAGICMSSMSVDQLVGYGLDPKQLTFALPAHDDAISPRRIVIGITSQNQSDDRKRGWMLCRLAKDLALNDFEFQIFGRGWNRVASCLEEAGAKVIVKEPSDNYRVDYGEIKSHVPYFDYYFYPGLDEGSLGTLDALAAGVKTIVTEQGFHLDLPDGITHGFWDYHELRDIFEEIICERRRRIEIARSLTWERYARRHLDIWLSLLKEDTLPAADRLARSTSKLTRPGPKRRYPVKGYLGLLTNGLRRDMALRHWFPQAYKTYYLGALHSGSDARYYLKTWLRGNTPFLFELLKRVKRAVH
jgi:hypothetical protein